jgi:tyrosine kinase 3
MSTKLVGSKSRNNGFLGENSNTIFFFFIEYKVTKKRTSSRRNYESMWINLSIVSYRLSVIGYQLLVIGYRLLVIGYRLCVVGYVLWVVGYLLSVVGYRLSVISCWLSVMCCGLSVIGYVLLLTV